MAIALLMTRAAFILARMGWRLRSGGADGADHAFGVGALGGLREYGVVPEIYLPWGGFSDLWPDEASGLINTPALENYEQAKSIILTLRPDLETRRGPLALHTRNVYQVLGRSLDLPSRKLLCWAPPVGKQGYVKGGTNTAVRLALQHQVPVLNLYRDEDCRIVEAFIERHELPLAA